MKRISLIGLVLLATTVLGAVLILNPHTTSYPFISFKTKMDGVEVIKPMSVSKGWSTLKLPGGVAINFNMANIPNASIEDVRAPDEAYIKGLTGKYFGPFKMGENHEFKESGHRFLLSSSGRLFYDEKEVYESK